MRKTYLVSVSISVEVELENESDFSAVALDVTVTGDETVRVNNNPQNGSIVDAFIVECLDK